jgi:polysaccharide biosynthesis protein PslH
MKVLFLSAFSPLPETNGSKIRAAGFLRSLERHDLYLVVIRHPGERMDADELNRLAKQVWDYEQPEMKRQDKLRNIFSRRPWLAEKYFSSRIKRDLQEIVIKHNIQVVVAETLLCAEYVRDLTGVYTIVDEHNLEFIRARRRLPLRRNPLAFIRDYLIYIRLKNYELKVLKKTSRTVVCSETDRTVLSALLPARKVSVIPNTVDTDYFTPGPETGPEPSLLFTGTLWYEPNADAVRLLIKEILPPLKAAFPETRLTIVGDTKGLDLSEYKKRKEAVFTGEVDDVRPFFRHSSLFLAPIRMGSGTRLKLLAAMAMGLPVISTRIGSEGLKVTHGENIYFAETPAEFQQAVIRLMNEPELYRELARGGRELVERFYSISAGLALLDRFWDRIKQTIESQ